MNATSKIPITVLVQTKNEEVGIAACLAGLGSFDEVIVVDSDSTDRTKEIARDVGAKVINFTWNGQYPKKKQWQLDNLETRNDWVLFLDADERPQPDLLAELTSLFSRPSEHVAFDIDLDYVFAGKILRHGHRVTKRCLVRAGHVAFPVMDDLGAPGMGELEGHYQPVAEGTVGKLRGRILHNDLDPVSSWFARHNKYSDWEAHLRLNEALRRDIASRRTLKGKLFDSVPFKPLAFFAYAYLGRGGFLDGRAGLDYAVALATYYWQIGLKSRELERSAVHDSGSAIPPTNGAKYGLYLAVLPEYRTACMEQVRSQFGGSVEAWVSDAHLDPSVKSDRSVAWYRHVKMIRLFGGRAFLQVGGISRAVKCDSLIVDLNPRSLSAWVLLLMRRAMGRRTLVWGHLFPQAGSNSRTSILRKGMRMLSSGVVTYTYTDGDRAQGESPRRPVWTAPNALYREEQIQPAMSIAKRNNILYVGRLTENKKVSVLIKSLPELLRRDGDIRLVLVGAGADESLYRELAKELGIEDRVEFAGWISNANDLRSLYGTAFAAASPGFLGLGVTQSLGFGVPMVISRDEPHSPEVELTGWGGVRWFETDNPASLAEQLWALRADRDALPLRELSHRVRDTYSAEAMAAGLVSALIARKEGGLK